MTETKFSKFPKDDFPTRWARFFHAGTDWFMLCEMLEEERKKPNSSALFYVWPFATGMTIELLVKSIVAQEDPAFDPQKKSYRHHTTNIINDYKNRIPVLNKISKDVHLMKVIKSYEGTIDTKFGDTTISINGDDQKKVMDATFEIREVVRIKAGFRN